jgi:hypothetical protein
MVMCSVLECWRAVASAAKTEVDLTLWGCSLYMFAPVIFGIGDFSPGTLGNLKSEVLRHINDLSNLLFLAVRILMIVIPTRLAEPILAQRTHNEPFLTLKEEWCSAFRLWAVD